MSSDPISIEEPTVQTTSLAQVSRHPKWRYDSYNSVEKHRLLWITRGQSRISFGPSHTTYGPNSVIFIPAGVPHSFEIKANVFGTLVEIEPLDFLEMPKVALLLRVRDVLEQGRFINLFENLQREIQSPSLGHQRACLYHAGLIGVWLERASSTDERSNRKTNGTERLVTKYLQLVEDRFSTGENVTDLAAALNVTPTHLTRCCKSCLSMSALSILNDRIQYEAKVLLADTTVNIKNIAVDLGFRSAAYFTRSFQQAHGVTPTEFRKQAHVTL